jgi:SAM-dependent methyltransferase
MRKDGWVYRLLTRAAPATAWKRALKPARLYLASSRLAPLSTFYGVDRGMPVDRFYIERFLEANRLAIRGRCLEIKDGAYTRRFGGARVSVGDVLDIDPQMPEATIHGDLRRLDGIENDRYDCIILTQVLQFIDEPESAVRECHRVLKPGGVLLATMPSIGRIDPRPGVERDFWRFTKAGASHLFHKVFEPADVEVAAHGNCRVGLAFWVGMSAEELTEKERAFEDVDFPVIVTVRAVKR